MSEDTFHKFKKDDVDQFMDNDLYLPTRTIYMGSVSTYEDGEEGGVDHFMAERITKNLHILDTYDSGARRGEKPINIIMNNPGGDVIHGMGIYDAIYNCKNHITIKVVGHAMSMGSIILQAADKRIMTRNSKIMIHYGYSGVYGHAKTSYQWNEFSKNFDRQMEEILLEKMEGKKIPLHKYLNLINKDHKCPTGNAKNKMIEITDERLEAMLNFDTIIDAETALALNLIDEIE
jgi:ATP-dependent protease ClpP protease subunit